MHVTKDEHYTNMDLPFYIDKISPVIPETIIDFHTHIWETDQWKQKHWTTDAAGGKYMVVEDNYSAANLISDGKLLFPDKTFQAVCFGQPSPSVDLAKTNNCAAKAGQDANLFPLLITGNALHTPDEIRRSIADSGFYGYKVMLNWIGDNYGGITVGDMIGEEEMKIACELGLIVLLHVPSARRLADRSVQAGVRELSVKYPKANIVLAHCGRCYMPDEMMEAISSIVDLGNVYLDTAMVMDPTVVQIAFEHIGPERVLFATDLPIAAMRGRRMYAMDHWVDVVMEGYPESAYRVISNNMHATYMVYEIILAIRRAAQMAGISDMQLKSVYFDNARRLLNNVHLS